MTNPEPMHSTEQDIIEQKVRRATAINALRKIGGIVAAERQADTDKAKVLRWFGYVWLGLLAAALGLYLLGVI